MGKQHNASSIGSSSANSGRSSGSPFSVHAAGYFKGFHKRNTLPLAYLFLLYHSYSTTYPWLIVFPSPLSLFLSLSTSAHFTLIIRNYLDRIEIEARFCQITGQYLFQFSRFVNKSDTHTFTQLLFPSLTLCHVILFFSKFVLVFSCTVFFLSFSIPIRSIFSEFDHLLFSRVF